MPMVDSNGVSLFYEKTGSGVPIVFIHPPLLTGEVFAYQRQQLSDTFQVITFDVRGHGKSGYSEEKVTYELIADDIWQLLNALNIPQAVICGYSTGGAVALEAMLAYPERFLGGVLISTMSELSDWYNKSRIWTARQLCKLSSKRLLSAAIAMGNADMMSTFKKLYSGAVQGQIRSMRQYFDCSYGYNCTHKLHRIHKPVLLIYGEKDTGFHRYARLIQRHVPHCTYHLIAGAQHQIPTKNPREMGELIRLWMADPALTPLSASKVVGEEPPVEEIFPLKDWLHREPPPEAETVHPQS
ncbi:alpha/beta fold hydrolase [Paenibacillus sp. UNC451MF]|uniref:alpha/beta fold hydrolase n=1 Tax=Paenibacillus sp. UNC451MF TaxID=1449063 RepID=UPI00068ADA9D|nr:alpha/beta hydrolase [Paenibacillus sp. UNC451MF]